MSGIAPIGNHIELSAEELAVVKEDSPQVYAEYMKEANANGTPVQAAPAPAQPDEIPELPEAPALAASDTVAPGQEPDAAPFIQSDNPLIPPLPEPAVEAAPAQTEPAQAAPAPDPALVDAEGNVLPHADELELEAPGQAQDAPAPAQDAPAQDAAAFEEAVTKVLDKRAKDAQAAQNAQPAAPEAPALAQPRDIPAEVSLEACSTRLWWRTRVMDALGDQDTADAVLNIATLAVERLVDKIVAPLHQRVQELEAKASGTHEALWEDKVRRAVIAKVPDWDRINNSPIWAAWLDEHDAMLRGPRGPHVIAAYQKGDVEGVVHYVTLFRNARKAQLEQTRSGGQTAAVSRAQVARAEPAATPMPTPVQAAPAAQSQGQRFTYAQYAEAMDMAAQEHRNGNSARATQIEEWANAAVANGQVSLQ